MNRRISLTLKGDINRTYAQTLCLIFFPGAIFPENIQDGAVFDKEENDVEIILSLDNTEEESIASAEMRIADRLFVGTRCQPFGLDSEKRAGKIALGRALCDAAQSYIGSAPPWGILSGVRPSKVAAGYLDRGLSREECVGVMKDEYCVSEEKAELIGDVIANQRSILRGLPKDSASLYLSVPFCPTRCAYCSFVSYSTKRLLSLIPEYIDRLCEDIVRVGREIKKDGKFIHTVYIGGGTPTILEPEQLKRILYTVSENIDLSGNVEFTVEGGRPDTITAEKLKTLAENGVTRISINPQTLNDGILKNIGRNHTADDFRRAYAIAKESGIRDINTDLIAGLPGDDLPSFIKTAEEIFSLSPENVTLHTFCVKKAADLNREESYSYFGGDAFECTKYMRKRASEEGYLPYYLYRQKNTVGNLENTGYSKRGKECLYNIFIMEEVHDIYGCGAGAVTKKIGNGGKIERSFMPKYPYEYLQKKDSEEE